MGQLYDYLKAYKKKYNRPSIFMPRLSELSYNNRDDIRSAIFRFYGSVSNLCDETNLIPFHEWNYFENQFLLFCSLQEYIQKYCTNDDNDKNCSRCFPALNGIKQRNLLLFKAIQQYGGKKLLARRLDMSVTTNKSTVKRKKRINNEINTIDYP